MTVLLSKRYAAGLTDTTLVSSELLAGLEGGSLAELSEGGSWYSRGGAVSVGYSW